MPPIIHRACLLACIFGGSFSATRAVAEFPLSLRRHRADLENPFQRSASQESQVERAVGAGNSANSNDVRLASLEGAWVDPPPLEAMDETTDMCISPGMQGNPDILFPSCQSPWFWQLLPDGLIYRSYMAGPREPRLGLVTFRERGSGDWLWDAALGGRRSLIRFGNCNLLHPEGFEVQIEGAALVRLNLEQNRDVDSVDFRVGVPLMYGIGNWQFKTGYYHLSSHLGDEFIVREQSAARINYVRDAILLGASYYPDPALRLYAETAYAFYTDGGADPWEFQLGFEYAEPGPTGCEGTPFVAANGNLRQELDFGGDFTFQAGWLWRGLSGSTLRMGLHFLTGKSSQYQFYDTSEEQVGFGVWYDY